MMKQPFVLLAATAAVMMAQTPADPWQESQLVEPKSLAAQIRNGDTPIIMKIGPAVLYTGAHIPGASYAGPANTPDGVRKLLEAVKGYRTDTPLVIYCGCCPMTRCPNIRPAFTALRDAGFTNVKVLALTESMHADWTGRGYPTEKPN